MGASRKLQGEIDRVLKKVQEGVDVFDSIWNKVYDTENANQKEKFEADLKKEIKKLQRYRDQIKTWIQSSEIKDKKALMDARKLIEREMERFKVCEKETKTKAFSKEGLGQQPKTDPKEKAKSETRDWLNNMVGDLENQIDNFEAEAEGFSGKKGKTKNPRLTHLEASIGRHKAHIMKLELILRLLDNDELSHDQVNDLKEFLEEYVECNQDDFERFADVDAFYSSLPLDKVEALEDLVTLCPSGLSKAALPVTSQLGADQDQSEETTFQDSNSDVAPKTPPSKSGAMGSLVSVASPIPCSAAPTGSHPTTTPIAVRPLVGGPSIAAILSSPTAIQGPTESPTAAVSSSLVTSVNLGKEDDNNIFPVRRPSPAIPEIAPGRGISRGSTPSSINSVSGITGNGALGSVSVVSDMTKRNNLSIDERMGNGGLTPSLVSPLSNRMLLQQVSKSNDGMGLNDINNISESQVIGGRVFSPSVSAEVQWRPQSTVAFQNQAEAGQFRGRPEIAPDQREKFLQRLQQVQQQGHSTLLTSPHLQGANHKQFPIQQQNSLLQQFNSQSSSLSPQMGLGLNMQSPGFNSVSSTQIQTPNHQQSSQHPLISNASKDADASHSKGDEQQQQQNTSEDLNAESTTNSSFNKIVNDEDLKSSYTVAGSSTMAESNQLPREIDLSPGQPLQPSQSSSSLGVIGRRSVSDLGAIGDNLGGSAGNSSIMHDQIYNMQMLEAAFYKLPQPKDSQRAKTYVPRHPAITPPSFPQTQADIVENPAFWERMGIDPLGTDTLFFAFYYQQNTYQQYLAARELKRQSWRYHRKYNTWFQRHEEPKVTNDEYEKGTYVYFDFHIADDGPQHGWCQRIKTEFTFEYSYLEDELVV